MALTPNGSHLNNFNGLNIEKNDFNETRNSFIFNKTSINDMNMILNESQTVK